MKNIEKKLQAAVSRDSKIVNLLHICQGYGGSQEEAGRHNDAESFARAELRQTPGEGSYIASEVLLPDEWNGEFVFCGNGGIGGSIPRDSMMQYLRHGFAVASTDMGTSRGAQSGVGNPDVWRDFGWRATYIATTDAEAIIKAYYGKEPEYSYFVGFSTGGEQAMAMAERFPELYDGILAGVPAFNRIFLHTYFLWNHNHLRK